MLRVLRTLCHPLQRSRFLRGGAKRSSLNQTLRNRFFFRYPDRWMDLSFYSYFFCKKPQILDLARKQSTALGPGSLGNELGCFSSTLLYFSVPVPHALRAPLALCLLSSYFFIGRFGWTSPFFPNENGKGCITSRCRFVFCPK